MCWNGFSAKSSLTLGWLWWSTSFFKVFIFLLSHQKRQSELRPDLRCSTCQDRADRQHYGRGAIPNVCLTLGHRHFELISSFLQGSHRMDMQHTGSSLSTDEWVLSVEAALNEPFIKISIQTANMNLTLYYTWKWGLSVSKKEVKSCCVD